VVAMLGLDRGCIVVRLGLVDGQSKQKVASRGAGASCAGAVIYASPAPVVRNERFAVVQSNGGSSLCPYDERTVVGSPFTFCPFRHFPNPWWIVSIDAWFHQ
jgi:hypothetical protein